MLKTQLSKAIYLCLFCFILSSFVPTPYARLAIPSSEDRFDVETSVATIAKSADMSLAPKVKMNRQELQFASKYIKNSIDDLISIRKRSKAPFTIIDSVFHRYGLPLQLKYLAVIESELKTSALSCVGAVGPWQLMPEIAHDLGLKTTHQNDERTNYYKSTRAAAIYLKDLYGQFGDWLLVLAAYNSGPGPVYAAIRKSGSRNFWALQSYLPAETRGHVKRFIATHYFFEGQGSVTTLTKAENVNYSKSVSAFAAAQAMAIPSAGKEIAVEKQTPCIPIDVVISNMMGFSDLSFKAAPKNETNGKAKGSQAERFNKLMKESEESLQKANRLIEG
jgi:membrane-bound lytic murein transglycosylase D